MHEKLMLTKNYERISRKESEVVKQVVHFRHIKSSKLIYLGHSEEGKFFYNQNENWVGMPDYIYKDALGKFFIVEEKFHRHYVPKEPDYSKDDFGQFERYDENYKRYCEWFDKDIYFYPNHLIQTYSYVRNISKIKIDYGYLIYWYYWYNPGSDGNDEPYVHRLEIKRLDKNNFYEDLYIKNKAGIENLKTNRKLVFQPDMLNPQKCAGCVVTKYCSHKSSRLKEVHFPYNLNQIQLYHGQYPDELKKNDNSGHNKREETYHPTNRTKSGFNPDEEKDILNKLFR